MTRPLPRIVLTTALTVALPIALTAALTAAAAGADPPPLVPAPRSVASTGGGSLPGAGVTDATPDAAWVKHLEVVAPLVDRLTGGRRRMTLSVPRDAGDVFVQTIKDPSLAPEEYRLKVLEEGTGSRVVVRASTVKGLAHGTATWLQLLAAAGEGPLSPVEIADAPQSPYRSVMIDMGRNPHGLALLKETVDLLWFYKIDSLHLHLTDDQRFAFPSEAFPKLWDGKITRAEFVALEAYAVARGVTLIPELEVPGHSSILRREYPETFGETEADLAASPTALAGIKTLLDEITAVFSSSPYVHVGGDEASGAPVQTQRALINTLHAYLAAQDRQTIVWEGPGPGTGENRVHRDVIQINWNTINYPAGQMLADGYRVVNASWDPLYVIDHYPRINFTAVSPQYLYETLLKTRFKHYEPGVPTYSNPDVVEPSDRLIGFCLPWWEGREENFLPMMVPRLIPFAEVAWGTPETADGSRDYEAFANRAAATEAARQAAFYPVAIEADGLAVPADGVFHRETQVRLTTSATDADGVVRYTLDGSEPTAASMRYSGPFRLSESATVRAALFQGGTPVGHGARRNFTAVEPVANLALGQPVTSTRPSGSPFSVERLTDGGTDNLGFYLAYPTDPEPVEITVDLGRVRPVRRIVVHAYTISGSFEKYVVETSADGKTFQQVGTRLDRPTEPEPAVTHTFPPQPVRYVRLRSFGNKGYVFDSFSKLTEIQVFE